MRKALVDLQCCILQYFRGLGSRSGDRHNLIVVAMHHEHGDFDFLQIFGEISFRESLDAVIILTLMMNRVLRVVLLLLWLELGLALILVPWSEVWDTNYFLYLYPSLAFLVKNSFLRGAISGLGLMNVLFALEAFRRRTAIVETRS